MKSSANIPQPENFILRPGQRKDIWGIIQLFYFDNLQIILCSTLLVVTIIGIICFTSTIIFQSFIAATTIIIIILIPGFILLIIALDILVLFNNSKDKILVFEYNKKIIAYIIYRTLENYSEINRLYVHSKYRHQGFGSRLVKTVIRNVKKPIYLISAPKALYFYIKLKFIPIPRHKLPKFYSVASRKGRIVLGYITE